MLSAREASSTRSLRTERTTQLGHWSANLVVCHELCPARDCGAGRDCSTALFGSTGSIHRAGSAWALMRPAGPDMPVPCANGIMLLLLPPHSSPVRSVKSTHSGYMANGGFRADCQHQSNRITVRRTVAHLKLGQPEARLEYILSVCTSSAHLKFIW